MAHIPATFQRTIVPLLRLAGSDAITKSTLVQFTNPFLLCVSQSVSLKKTVAGRLEAMAATGRIEDPSVRKICLSSDAKCWVPESWHGLLLPIVKYCIEILKRFENEEERILEDVRKVQEPMRKMVSKFSRPEDMHVAWNRALKRLMDDMDSLIALKSGQYERGREIMRLRREKEAYEAVVKKLFPESAGELGDPPGELRREGKRHDNDDIDIRNIRIAPSAEEVLCDIPPYLPANRPGELRYLADAREAHRDMHFRLLRHDMMAPLQQAISAFKEKGGISGLQWNRDVFVAKSAGGSRFVSDVDVHVYRNVSIGKIGSSGSHGVHFLVMFDDVSRAARLRRHEHMAWWKKTKRLQHGTLVCLWWEDGGQAPHPAAPVKPRVVFGIINERSEELLSPAGGGRPAIGIRFTDGEFDMDVLKAVLGRQLGGNSEVVMLQAGGSFFGYAPVLKALRTAPIPLAQYIAAKPSTQRTSAKMTVLPPEYLVERREFDFSCLAASKGSESARPIPGLDKVDLTSAGDELARLITMNTTLDLSQASAVKEALTKELAIIQGPPGTGKTFLGIQIVRLLIENSRRRGLGPRPGAVDQGPDAGVPIRDGSYTPILCVCYTNHALDQFLAGLKDSGVTNIVRLGGKIRREDVEEFNIYKRVYGKATEAQWFRKKQCDKEIEGTSKAMESIVREIERLESKAYPYLAEVQYILEIKAPHLMLSLVESGWQEGSGGFESPGRNGAAQRWLQWCKGPKKRARKRHTTQEQGGIATSNIFELLGIANESGEADVLAEWRRRWRTQAAEEEEASPQEPIPKGNRPLEQLLNGASMWSMSRQERQKVIRYLVDKKVEDLMEDLEMNIKRNEGLVKDLQNVQDDINLGVMKSADVVGMTTSKVASCQKLVAALSPKIVIVEEAAEVLEAHILTSLSEATQHLILIGDHEQLRPKPELYELQVESGVGLNLDLSLFERLVRSMNFPYASLSQQRRMRPEFSELVRRTIYSALSDHPSVQRYPNVKGISRNLFFINHDHPEAGQDEGRSKSNTFEVKFAVRLARHLINQGQYGEGDIAIITPYVGQLLKIRAELNNVKMKVILDERDEEILADLDQGDEGDERQEGGEPNNTEPTGPEGAQKTAVETRSLKDSLRIATIDNFQGEEAKVIILSLVRNQKKGVIGFLGVKNRINVLLSRAMHGMYIIGNVDSLLACKKSKMWTEVLDTLETNGCIGPELECVCQNHPNDVCKIRDWEDFDTKVPDGGCDRKCEFRLACGHSCPRFCHSNDQKHLHVDCMERCKRELECGHPCERLCFQPCGLCTRILPEVQLKCGHKLRHVQCFRAQDKDELTCLEMVQVTVAKCGHTITVHCYDAERYQSGALPCPEKVPLKMSICGHTIKAECGKKAQYIADPKSCTATCGAPMKCGDLCEGTCGKCLDSSGTSRRHPPCRRVCKRTQYCGHDCMSQCHTHELREKTDGGAEIVCPPCENPCTLRCKHSTCHGRCKEACSPCTHECEWECEHRGRCPLPCGAPCVRLPCDHRCQKKLECGHRCPGVCGEECPDRRYCLQCAPKSVKDQVVDYCLFGKFGDLTEEMVDNDPIVVLGCGHVLTMSNMDQHMEISRFYGRADESGSKWTHPLLLPSDTESKGCIVCRQPIRSVKRYGRISNKTVLDLTEKVFVDNYERMLSNAWSRQMEAEEEMKTVFKGEKELESMSKMKTILEENSGVFTQVHRDCMEISHPKYRLFTRSRGLLRDLASEQGDPSRCTEEMVDALGVHQPDFTVHSRALLGVGRATVAWLFVNTRHMCAAGAGIDAGTSGAPPRANRARGNSRAADKKADKMKLIRKIANEAMARYAEAVTALEEATECAAKSKSTATGLEVAKTKVELGVMMVTHIGASAKLDVVKEALNCPDYAADARDIQLKLLEHVKAIGEGALEAVASPNSPKTPAIAQISKEIRKILQSLPQLEKDVRDSGHPLEAQVIWAVISADIRRTYGNGRTYGSGHVYRCPNGHVYIIGECGRAMETSRCAECGAVIGGSHHTLTEGNRSADDALEAVTRLAQQAERAAVAHEEAGGAAGGQGGRVNDRRRNPFAALGRLFNRGGRD